MTRPSADSDQRLISAALVLLDENGFSGLKIRQVAAKAKVNLGMFHYHFKTKDEFARRVLQTMYEKFFRDFSLGSDAGEKPLDRLRGALNLLGRFNRDNRRLLLGMFNDTLQGRRVASHFVKDNFYRHGRVVVDLIRKCQAEGALHKRPIHQVLPTLMGAMMGPNLLMGMVEHSEAKTFFGVAVKTFKGLVLSDEAIAERIDIVLRGLGAPERKHA